MQKVMIFVLFLNFASFGLFLGGGALQKNPLQKVDAGQSGSQSWRKTSKILKHIISIKEQHWVGGWGVLKYRQGVSKKSVNYYL